MHNIDIIKKCTERPFYSSAEEACNACGNLELCVKHYVGIVRGIKRGNCGVLCETRMSADVVPLALAVYVGYPPHTAP